MWVSSRSLDVAGRVRQTYWLPTTVRSYWFSIKVIATQISAFRHPCTRHPPTPATLSFHPRTRLPPYSRSGRCQFLVERHEARKRQRDFTPVVYLLSWQSSETIRSCSEPDTWVQLVRYQTFFDSHYQVDSITLVFGLYAILNVKYCINCPSNILERYKITRQCSF